MPRHDYAYCKNCDGHKSVVGPLSYTRLCATCADAIQAENILGLATMSNPKVTSRWRRGMILSAGGLLPEQLQPRS